MGRVRDRPPKVSFSGGFGRVFRIKLFLFNEMLTHVGYRDLVQATTFISSISIGMAPSIHRRCFVFYWFSLSSEAWRGIHTDLHMFRLRRRFQWHGRSWNLKRKNLSCESNIQKCIVFSAIFRNISFFILFRKKNGRKGPTKIQNWDPAIPN